MPSAPVNFLVLRHLLMIAEIAEHDGRPDGVTMQLRRVMDQLDAYGDAAPDDFRVTVELAIDGTVKLRAVFAALEHWAFASATETTYTTVKTRMRKQAAGAKGGKNPGRRLTAEIRADDWERAARILLKHNKDLSPASIGKRLAESPEEAASAGYIAKVLRKRLK